jgi:hypothetical protein
MSDEPTPAVQRLPKLATLKQRQTLPNEIGFIGEIASVTQNTQDFCIKPKI